jgi:hypothetical protein
MELIIISIVIVAAILLAGAREVAAASLLESALKNRSAANLGVSGEFIPSFGERIEKDL